MSKVLNIYRGYSATDINTRSSDTCDHSVSGSTVVCTNVKASKVKTLLSAANYALSTLCTHAGINHWAAYSPTIRTISALNIVNSDPTDNYSLGSFAGYNHTAITPGWQTGGLAAAQATIWVNAGSLGSKSVNINVGEPRYGDEFSIDGITLALYNAATNLVGWGSRNFSVVKDDVTTLSATVSASVYPSGMSVDETLTGKIWLVDDTTDFDDTQQQCYSPGTAAFDFDVKIKQFSEWHYDGDAQTIPSPWVQNGTAGLNLTTGYFDIGMIARNNNYTNLKITAKLFDWEYTLIGEDDIYDAAYTALDDITGSVYLGLDPIVAYGYHAIVYFYYTI
jgi:hypothetical protein